eukprot:3707109-Rhodomonas_salina.1
MHLGWDTTRSSGATSLTCAQREGDDDGWKVRGTERGKNVNKCGAGVRVSSFVQGNTPRGGGQEQEEATKDTKTRTRH